MVVTSASSPSQSHKTADGGKRSLEITSCNPCSNRITKNQELCPVRFLMPSEMDNHSGLPISVLDHSHCEKVFSCIQMEFHWF